MVSVRVPSRLRNPRAKAPVTPLDPVARPLEKPRGMSLFDSIHQLREGLDYHLTRHNLLTANLAQLDTPGFRPRDLARTRAFDQVLDAESLRQGDDGATASSSSLDARPSWRVVEDPGSAPGLDGNSVSLDREAVKIAVNQLRYDVIAQMTQGDLKGLDWAANDGRGA